MTTIGIVAEWNPFHNGHQRLVNQIRADRPEAVIVSVMSGAFCQRGEVSCFDKWLRTEMALAAGVDVVLELPQVYATASLEGFARGGVATLLAFAPLDGLYCGSESGDLAALTAQADYLRAHQREFDLAMRTAGENGMNYAQASQEFLRAAGFCSDKNTPNDRLALWYRMSLPREIPMQLVQRSVAHDANEAAAQTMSASAIRSHLPDRLNDIADYLPQTSLAIMRCALTNDWRPANEEKLLTALQVLCAALEPEDLAKRLTIRDGWRRGCLPLCVQQKATTISSPARKRVTTAAVACAVCSSRCSRRYRLRQHRRPSCDCSAPHRAAAHCSKIVPTAFH